MAASNSTQTAEPHHQVNSGCTAACCPGFGQDRVNFHQEPGGLPPPGQTEQGIPYHAGFRWGGAGWWEVTLTCGSGARSSSGRGERLSELCSLCCVFPLPVSLLLFPLFAVLLNCPYPDPPVSACFFPFSSAPQRGEGRLCGAFVASRSQTITSP